MKKQGLYIKIGIIILIQLFAANSLAPSFRSLYMKKTSLTKGQRSPGTPPLTKIYSYKTVDKCHIFSGERWTDDARGEISKSDPFFLNPVEPILKPDDGQMMALLLYDQVRARDVLRSRYYDHFKNLKNTVSENSLLDGISSIYYDLGNTIDNSDTNNVSASILEMLSIDALVAPTYIDYVIISLLSPEHFKGGIAKLVDYRSDIPFLVPPGKDARALFRSYGCEVKNLIVLEKGYSQLSQRIGALVLQSEDQNYEIDLVIRVKGGIAIIASEGTAGMETIIGEAEQATGRKTLLYAGGTGLLMGMDDERRVESMKHLKSTHPSLIILANYSTSLLSDHYLREIFGTNYHSVYLGTSISLSNPSFLYRCMEH